MALPKNKGGILLRFTNESKKTYIPKTEKEFATQLACKKYLSLKLKELMQEEKALSLYLRHHVEDSQKAEQLLTEIPGYHELLSPLFLSKSQKVNNWIHASFNQNPQHPEHKKHKILSGEMVRSKSEALIATLLLQNNIPFRYECELQLNEGIFYPDFTILNPDSMTVCYWDHFGMMDNPSYAQKTFSKMQIYNSNGIMPSHNLITTFESQDHPLTTETIQNIIDYYFL